MSDLKWLSRIEEARTHPSCTFMLSASEAVEVLELASLRDQLAAAGEFKTLVRDMATRHPRAMKLIVSGEPFFVVKASEPYARQVVALIKADQGPKWTQEDEELAESVLPPPPADKGVAND